MSKYVKVENCKELVRDSNSRAILNTNATALDEAKKRKEAKLSEQNRINTLEEKVDRLTDIVLALLNRIESDGTD